MLACFRQQPQPGRSPLAPAPVDGLADCQVVGGDDCDAASDGDDQPAGRESPPPPAAVAAVAVPHCRRWLSLALLRQMPPPRPARPDPRQLCAVGVHGSDPPHRRRQGGAPLLDRDSHRWVTLNNDVTHTCGTKTGVSLIIVS